MRGDSLATINREAAAIARANPPPLEVRALAATFYVSGELAEVGKAYELERTAAETLIATGKAERISA